MQDNNKIASYSTPSGSHRIGKSPFDDSDVNNCNTQYLTEAAGMRKSSCQSWLNPGNFTLNKPSSAVVVVVVVS
jgi:hypothetical protein